MNWKYILEVALFASPKPLTLEHLQQLFEERDRLSTAQKLKIYYLNLVKITNNVVWNYVKWRVVIASR